jgi:hypothetical protein
MQSQKEYKTGRNFLASFISSITVKTMIAPFERVKIFMQTDINNLRFKKANKGREIVNYRKYIKVNNLYIGNILKPKQDFGLMESTFSNKVESDHFGMGI